MADERFEACLAEVLRHEGGYVDHPSDPGGATNMGITRKTLARWRGISPWAALPKGEVRALTRAEAARIYRADYWDRCKAGQMPAGLDLALFDFAVNSGPDRAIKTLQRLIGVAADGLVGPMTLGAVSARAGKTGTAALVDALCNARLAFLKRLSTFPVFGRGWTARVAAVRKTAQAAVTQTHSNPNPNPWSNLMNLLSGYRTYIAAALMLATGIAQILGIDLPAFDGQSGGQLVLEAIAIIFLRKGLKGTVGGA